MNMTVKLTIKIDNVKIMLVKKIRLASLAIIIEIRIKSYSLSSAVQQNLSIINIKGQDGHLKITF